MKFILYNKKKEEMANNFQVRKVSNNEGDNSKVLE